MEASTDGVPPLNAIANRLDWRWLCRMHGKVRGEGKLVVKRLGKDDATMMMIVVAKKNNSCNCISNARHRDPLLNYLVII